METLQHSSASSPPRGWVAWASILLAAYAVVHLIGWRRTLTNNEVWALYESGQSFKEQLHAIRDDLVHPPLWYLVERLWIDIFGQTDSGAKALALVANLPTFFLFTLLAGRVTRHWRLASFLFLAVYLRLGNSPNQVRMYGLGLLLTVVAMVLWDDWHESGRNGTLVAWSMIAVLLIYTHLFGVLMVMAFVIVNWLWGPRRWAFTFAAGLVGLAFLPWILYVYPVFASRGLESNLAWVPQRLHVATAYLAYELLGRFPFGNVRQILAVAGSIVTLMLAGLGLQVARHLWPPRRSLEPCARWFWSAVILTGAPIAAVFLFSVVEIPSLHARFVLGVLPAYWLLIVLVCQAGGRPGRLVMYGLVLPWAIANVGLHLVMESRPSPARRAALAAAVDHSASDLILCQGACNQFYWEWTHRLDRTGRLEFLSSGATPARLSVLPQTSLENVDLAGVDRVWFFYYGGAGAEPLRDFLTRNGFALKKQFPEGQPFLLLFARPVVSTRCSSFPYVSHVFLPQQANLAASPSHFTSYALLDR